MTTNYRLDIREGISCRRHSCKDRKASYAEISLILGDATYAAVIDLGIIRGAFRVASESRSLVASDSQLGSGYRIEAASEALITRRDLEDIPLWPVARLTEPETKPRNLDKCGLANARSTTEGTKRVSLSMLRSGLTFPTGTRTSIMQQPEVVALIEGVDFAYPDPRFISDMTELSSKGLGRRDADWFRSSADLPLMWRTKACVLCRSTDLSVRHIIGPSRIVRCNQCGLEFDNPQAIIRREHYDKYSSRFDQLRRATPSKVRARQNAAIFVADVDALCPMLTHEPVLDVGCASGEFLHVLDTRYGWPVTQLLGVDPSALSAGDAHDRYGVEVLVSQAERIPLDTRRFPLITILNSIEHFADPHLALRQLRKLIAPHGMLFIGTVPNVNSLPSLLFPEGFIAKNQPDGQHPYHFSPDTLCKLCANEGFDLVLLRGRQRDIVGQAIEGCATWLAYTCGVPGELLGRSAETLMELNRQVKLGQTLTSNMGSRYRFAIEPSDFESAEHCISFWRREIWPRPYLSDAFDAWFRPSSR